MYYTNKFPQIKKFKSKEQRQKKFEIQMFI